MRSPRRFCGFLPFKRCLFLNAFRKGAGGLEHKNSALWFEDLPRAENDGNACGSYVLPILERLSIFEIVRERPNRVGPMG